MNKIFVDTWAWYALVDTTDGDHAVAQLALEDLLNDAYTFVTTNFVIAETITLMRYNLNHQASVEFYNRLQQLIADELVEFVRIEDVHESNAWQIFEKYKDQDFSYVDCTSFAVMRAYRLTQVSTADHHFAVIGFSLTP